MNVYLIGAELTKLGGFKKDLSMNDRSRYLLGDLAISKEKGRYLVKINLHDRIPEEVAEIVEEITLLENVSKSLAREAGIYRHGKAEATLDLASEFNPSVKLFITSPNLDDLNVLYVKIMAGEIRPESSFEQPQLGKSRVELQAALDQLRKNTHGMQQALLVYAGYLSDHSGRLPVVSKVKVSKTILAIANARHI